MAVLSMKFPVNHWHRSCSELNKIFAYCSLWITLY